MQENITEKKVTAMWQSLLAAGCDLESVSGEPLRIIYSGKNSDRPGSDFQDAVVTVDSHTIRGNIEVHVKSSDWYKHEHHRNPEYNGVVLHVVMWHDCLSDIKLQNGVTIPTITIDRYMENISSRLAQNILPCSGIGVHNGEKLVEVLAAGGKARFYEKASRFQHALKYQEPGQCLYSGVMGALGYAHNTDSFRKLAEKVPLSVLESVPESDNTDEIGPIYQQAILLGNAGLLPSQSMGNASPQFEDYPYINDLEVIWKSTKHINAMSLSDWQVFRVRPSNFPIRRIVGISGLIQLYQEKGLLDGLIELVQEVSTKKSYTQLQDGLMVADDTYWRNHFAFFKQCQKLSKWIIGQSRADDIIVNVLLPFAYALSKNKGQKELSEKACTLFCSYPALGTNTIERHMKVQFSLKNSQINSTLRQQGLLHLYKGYCTQGRCGECNAANIV